MPFARLSCATLVVALALVSTPAFGDGDAIPRPRPPAPTPAPAPTAAPAPAAVPEPVAPSPSPDLPKPPPPATVGAASEPAIMPAPTEATDPVGEAPLSLESIAQEFDAEERTARREVLRRRYDATATYLLRNPTAKDAEEARGALVTLAFDSQAWDLVPAGADVYLARHAAGSLVSEVLYERAYALAKLGRGAECRKAYDLLTRTVNLKQHTKGVVLRAWSSYATYLADQGDVGGAKIQWATMKAVFQTLGTDGTPFMNMADDEIKYLGLVGREPLPFPADARDLEGRPISLAEYRGRYVLLDFWATWCKPCVEELPNVVEAYRRHHEKGLEIVGIVVNEPSDGAKVRAFVAEKRLPWRQIHYATTRNPIPPAYGVHGVPYTMLIGPDGRVIRVGLRGADLRTSLDRLFAVR